MAVHDINRDNRAEQEAQHRSFRGLFGDLANELSTLFRQEVALVRAETNEKVSQARTGVTWLAVGGLISLVSLFVLAMSAVYALAEVMHIGWAALIVGGVALVIGLIFLASGRSHLKARNMMPQRSSESIRQDAEVARRRMQ